MLSVPCSSPGGATGKALFLMTFKSIFRPFTEENITVILSQANLG